METESENKNGNPEEEVNSEPKIAEEEAHDVKSEKEDLDSKQHLKIFRKIQETYAQNEDWQDKYIRVLADLENLKRRQIKGGRCCTANKISDFWRPSTFLGRISNGHA